MMEGTAEGGTYEHIGRVLRRFSYCAAMSAEDDTRLSAAKFGLAGSSSANSAEPACGGASRG